MQVCIPYNIQASLTIILYSYQTSSFNAIHIIADAVVLPDMTAYTLLFQNAILEYILRLILRSAPLLPKLRGHFAEFLNESSLAHLRILSSTTCVGLRYGQLIIR